MAHILGPVGVSCPARLVQGVFPTSCLRMTFFSLLTKLWVLIEMTSCTGRPAVAPGTRKQPWFLGSYTHTHTHTRSLVQKRQSVYVSPQAWYRKPTEIPAIYRMGWRQVQGTQWETREHNKCHVYWSSSLSEWPYHADVGTETKPRATHMSVCVSPWVHSSLKSTEWKACKALCI